MRHRTYRVIQFVVISVLSFSVLSACSARQDFSYQPEKIEGLPQTGLRIAVMSFSDRRKQIDSGSTAWAYVPGIPTAAATVDAPQQAQDRSRAEYFFPDLVAYGLVLDLIQNNTAEVVHFVPELTDDYDLVIDGSIHGMERTERKFTYGLGPAAFAVWMFGLPPNAKAVDFRATYRIRDGSGKALFEKEIETSWSEVNYNSSEQHSPIMEGINSTIRENNTKFLTEASGSIAAAHVADIETKRARRFYSKLDPELKSIDERRRQLVSQGQNNSPRFARIVNEIRRRESWLEKYRKAERQVVAKQQEYVHRHQQLHLDRIGQIRQQKRAIEAQQQELQRQANMQQRQAVGQAVLAGVLPAYSQARQAGDWNSQHSADAMRDMASALGSIPPPGAPPPDLTPYLQELDVSMSGLESAGGNPFQDLRGGSVAEIRQKFLSKYRSMVIPLANL